MKLLVIAILCVGGFFLYQTMISSVQKSYAFCIDQATANKDDAMALSCGAKKQIYTDLYSCVQKVQADSTMGSLLYTSTGTKNKVELLIEEHNTACPQSTVSAPGESLYLGN